eukprot:PITA_15814
MTGKKELFSDLEEKDLQMHIKMGDNGKHSVSGLGTIASKREHGTPLTLENVMYLPGLKKNLVSIAILEDRGYDVIFSKEKAFLRHSYRSMQQLVWVDVMLEEYDSIFRKSVRDVVPRPEEKSVVSSCWLYKVKQVADGSVEKHKPRFVARGFSQVEGIDYDETFALVARYLSIRSILALSA